MSKKTLRPEVNPSLAKKDVAEPENQNEDATPLLKTTILNEEGPWKFPAINNPSIPARVYPPREPPAIEYPPRYLPSTWKISSSKGISSRSRLGCKIVVLGKKERKGKAGYGLPPLWKV